MADAVAQKGFRPALPSAGGWIEEPLLALTRQCWDQQPDNRPAFLDVLHLLENINTQTADAGYVMEKNEL
jgi:hypothetical protein